MIMNTITLGSHMIIHKIMNLIGSRILFLSSLADELVDLVGDLQAGSQGGAPPVTTISSLEMLFIIILCDVILYKLAFSAQFPMCYDDHWVTQLLLVGYLNNLE